MRAAHSRCAADHAMSHHVQAEGQLGECMLYTLAEWVKEQLPGWLEQSVIERSMPAATSTADATLSPAAGKEVMSAFIMLTCLHVYNLVNLQQNKFCSRLTTAPQPALYFLMADIYGVP